MFCYTFNSYQCLSVLWNNTKPKFVLKWSCLFLTIKCQNFQTYFCNKTIDILYIFIWHINCYLRILTYVVCMCKINKLVPFKTCRYFDGTWGLNRPKDNTRNLSPTQEFWMFYKKKNRKCYQFFLKERIKMFFSISATVLSKSSRWGKLIIWLQCFKQKPIIFNCLRWQWET